MAIEALLVLLLLVSPGLIADGLYRFLLWRPDPEENSRVIRSLLFSSLSLLAVLGLADWFPEGGWKPVYLVPDWWRAEWRGDFASALQITLPWVTHTAIAIALAVLGVVIMKRDATANFVRWVTGQSLHRNAWDEFAAANHKRWVFVRLVDGRHYYGELGVVSGDRGKDIVLWKPYPYSEKDQTYEITGAEGAFIPGDQIASVIVSLSPQELARVKPDLGVYSIRTGERVK